MAVVGFTLLAVLRLFEIVLIVRLIIEMVQSFSRNFAPPRGFYLIAEPIFVVTDPPVKLLRKAIPPLRMGGVALDISVIVLFLLVTVLQIIVTTVFL